jgi:four helix bundle protein
MGHSYADLKVWQKAIDLVTDVYKHTKLFPKEEIYGLTSQIRRAAVSIPCNIAEGQGRLTRGEFKQFLGHARGSLPELQTPDYDCQKIDVLGRRKHVESDEVLYRNPAHVEWSS